MDKHLFRNEHEKWIAGVCAGLAEYLEVDVKIIRILFVLGVPFLAGTSILVYIVMWIIVPPNNDPARFNKFNQFYKDNQFNNSMFNSTNPFNNPTNSGDQTKWNTPNVGQTPQNPFDPTKFRKQNDTGRTIGGLIILMLGVYLLLKQFGIVPEWFSIFKIYKLWPIAIIAVGISLIFRNQRKTEWEKFKKSTEEAQEFGKQPIAPDAPEKVEDNPATPNP